MNTTTLIDQATVIAQQQQALLFNEAFIQKVIEKLPQVKGMLDIFNASGGQVVEVPEQKEETEHHAAKVPAASNGVK